MITIEQGSAEWLALRVGKVTASKVADVVAKTKTGWGASRANYMAALVAERLTGVPQEGFTNGAMQWGIDTEPEARAAYQFEKGLRVVQVGFVDHPTIPMSGASPDGLVGDGGLVEVKCPNTATHIETLLSRSIPDKYLKQMQWQMACTGRLWCDFVSYDPRMPEEMRLWVQRVARDEPMIESLHGYIVAFLSELDEKVAALSRLYAPPMEVAAA